MPEQSARRVIAVAGPRELGPFAFGVSLSIDAYFANLPEKVHVIHGNARGTDKMCVEAAHRHGHSTEPFPVLRRDADAARAAGQPERKAPLWRTRRMLDTKPPSELVAWWNRQSGGTGFTIAECGRRGIPVTEFDLTGAAR